MNGWIADHGTVRRLVVASVDYSYDILFVCIKSFEDSWYK
jgi:hypothetical protein